MTTATEREPTAEPAGPRRWFTDPRLTLPVGCGVAVFFVNNFLLARVLTALPGGTVLAPTTMLGVAWATLRVRRFGAATLLYATYGVLGTLGHLGVDAGTYVLRYPRVLAAALLFDAAVALGRYRGGALLVALLPCAGVLLFGASLPPSGWLLALGLARAGLATGLLGQAWLQRRRMARGD